MRSSGLLLVKLADTLSALNTLDLSRLCDGTIRTGVLDLLVTANRTQAQLTRFLGQFDERALATSDGLKTSQAWLHAYGRLAASSARAQVRAVRTVALLPRVAAALEEGAIGLAHVNQIGLMRERLGADIARDAEAILVDLARAASPTEVRHACAYLYSVLEPDGPR